MLVTKASTQILGSLTSSRSSILPSSLQNEYDYGIMTPSETSRAETVTSGRVDRAVSLEEYDNRSPPMLTCTNSKSTWQKQPQSPQSKSANQLDRLADRLDRMKMQLKKERSQIAQAMIDRHEAIEKQERSLLLLSTELERLRQAQEQQKQTHQQPPSHQHPPQVSRPTKEGRSASSIPSLCHHPDSVGSDSLPLSLTNGASNHCTEAVGCALPIFMAKIGHFSPSSSSLTNLTDCPHPASPPPSCPAQPWPEPGVFRSGSLRSRASISGKPVRQTPGHQGHQIRLRSEKQVKPTALPPGHQTTHGASEREAQAQSSCWQAPPHLLLRPARPRTSDPLHADESGPEARIPTPSAGQTQLRLSNGPSLGPGSNLLALTLASEDTGIPLRELIRSKQTSGLELDEAIRRRYSEEGATHL